MDTKWKSWNSEIDVISEDVMLKVWYIWQTLEQQILNKYLYKYFFKVLGTHLLQNVIQDNIEKIYFDWFMKTVTKSVIECQFSLNIFNLVQFFQNELKKICSHS